jgi:hypothetical protein
MRAMIEKPAPLSGSSRTVVALLSLLLVAAVLGGAAWGVNTLINGGVVHKPAPPECSAIDAAPQDEACP